MSRAADAIAWVMIGAVAIGYARTRPVQAQIARSTVRGRPDQSRIVDLTRWRHDGAQPLAYSRGNMQGMPGDETATALFSQIG